MLKRKKNEPSPHDPLTASERKMVEKNAGLVYSIATQKRLKHNLGHAVFDDITQAGFLGLMRAAQKFDPTRGNKFSTVAMIWIKSKISHELRRRPVGNSHDMKLATMISIDAHPSTIDFCGVAEGGQRLIDAEIDAEDLLQSLNPRELICVRGFMEGRTLENIGEELGIHRERVRQIREASIVKLRQELARREIGLTVKASDFNVASA